MKSKFYYFPCLIIGIVFFISCEKKPTPGGGTGSGSGTCKISAITGYFSAPITIQYDSADRIKSVYAPNLSRTYSYPTGLNVIDITTKINGRESYRTKLIFNTETKKLDTFFKSYPDFSYELRTYEYSGNYLYKVNINKNTVQDSIVYKWEGGNISNYKKGPNTFFPQGKIAYHVDQAFAEGDWNNINNFIEDGYNTLGPTSNLVQSNYSGNITYKFNSNGKIRQASSSHDGYPTITYNYEYSCK